MILKNNSDNKDYKDRVQNSAGEKNPNMTIYKKHIRIHSRFLFSERMSLVTITSIKVEDDF